MISAFVGAALIHAIPMMSRLTAESFSVGADSLFNPEKMRQAARDGNQQLRAALDDTESPLFQQFKKNCEKRGAKNLDFCAKSEIQWHIDYNEESIIMTDLGHGIVGTGIMFMGLMPSIFGFAAGSMIGFTVTPSSSKRRGICSVCDPR